MGLATPQQFYFLVGKKRQVEKYGNAAIILTKIFFRGQHMEPNN